MTLRSAQSESTRFVLHGLSRADKDVYETLRWIALACRSACSISRDCGVLRACCLPIAQAAPPRRAPSKALDDGRSGPIASLSGCWLPFGAPRFAPLYRVALFFSYTLASSPRALTVEAVTFVCRLSFHPPPRTLCILHSHGPACYLSVLYSEYSIHELSRTYSTVVKPDTSADPRWACAEALRTPWTGVLVYVCVCMCFVCLRGRAYSSRIVGLVVTERFRCEGSTRRRLVLGNRINQIIPSGVCRLDFISDQVKREPCRSSSYSFYRGHCPSGI